jgi:ketosteroid isomerase-like protein
MDVDETVAFLELAYRRFNAREIDDLLAMLTDDVEWPDVANGTTVRGRDAVRAYWQAQFASTDPRVTPTGYIPAQDDLVVEVEQRLLDLQGKPLRPPATVYHRYTFDGDRVRRMQVFEDRNDAVVPR